MVKTQFNPLLLVAGLIAGFVAWNVADAATSGKNSSNKENTTGTIIYNVKTDIREIHTGMLDGQEYLTIEINRVVGPMACRSNVLRLNTDATYTEKIETVAFSAVMQQDQVMITVPLQQSDCVNGSPPILDMYLLHNS